MSKLAKIANRVPFAPAVALMLGGAAAVVVTSMPVWLLERVVEATGLPTVVAAAKAPLGAKARILLSVGIPALVAVAGFVAALPFGRKLGKKSGTVKGGAIKPYNKVRDALDLADHDEAQAPARSRGIFDAAPVAEESAWNAEPVDMEISAPADDRFDTPYVEVREEVAADTVPVFPSMDVVAVNGDAQELTLGFDQIADIPEAPAEMPAAAASAPMDNMGWQAPVETVAVAPVVMDYAVPAYTVPEAPGAQWAVEEPVQDFTPAFEMSPVESAVDMPATEVAPLSFELPAPVAEAPLAFELPAEAVHVEGAPVEAAQVQAAPEPSIGDLVGQLETNVRRRQLNNLVSPASIDQNDQGGDVADAALRDALGTLERLAAGAR